MNSNVVRAQLAAVETTSVGPKAQDAVVALVNLYTALLNVEREEKRQLQVALAKSQQEAAEAVVDGVKLRQGDRAVVARDILNELFEFRAWMDDLKPFRRHIETKFGLSHIAPALGEEANEVPPRRATGPDSL